MRMRLVSLLVAALVLGAVTSSAFAADYPPGTATFSLRDANGNITRTFSAGQLARMVAQGLTANALFTVSFHQSPDQLLASPATDSTGVFDTTFRIPSSAQNGAATLVVEHGVDVHTVGINIVNGRGVSGGIGLPKTGAQIARLVAWAMGLLVAGTVLVLFARRRRAKVHVS